MMNIAKNELYISKIYHVTKSQTTRKLSSVEGRWSDGFILILEGECHYDFDDGHSFTVRAGDLMYLAKDAFYKMEIKCDPYRYIYTDFDFICEEKRKSACVTLKKPAETEVCFRKLMKSMASSAPEAIAGSLSLLYLLYSDFISASFPSYITPSSKNSVMRAKAKIAQELSSPHLSVGGIAEELKISEVHFRKLFKASEGVTPAKYIVLSRLERAKMLVRGELLSLEEIAIQCGFSSLPYFCKVFSEKTGMTPSEYRRAQKSNKNPL